MTTEHPIRVIIFREGEIWVAQCLEYDIGAQAENLDKLQIVLNATIRAELSESIRRNGSPFNGIPPAPSHFQAMWAKKSNFFEAKNSPVGMEMALVA